MLTQITNDLWLDLEKIIRVAKDGDEVKYTIDFKERMVTYSVEMHVGARLLTVLQEKELQKLLPVKELIEQMVNNPNGDTA
jgi:translation initiation factor IF-3